MRVYVSSSLALVLAYNSHAFSLTLVASCVPIAQVKKKGGKLGLEWARTQLWHRLGGGWYEVEKRMHESPPHTVP